jgi:predicted house-cleaning NTP pyrophosphatase (Maf/HAM1 superfamily)
MISMAKDYTPALILASSSPRRRELLRLLSPDFLVVPPEVEEAEAQTPEDLLGIAEAKAAAVAQKFPKKHCDRRRYRGLPGWKELWETQGS